MNEPRQTEANPLLEAEPLPRFGEIAPGHVEPAVRLVLAEQRAALARAVGAEEPDVAWLQGLEGVHDALHRVWSPVAHLNSVASSPELRDAFNRCLPLVTEFTAEVGQNEALYRQLERVRALLPAVRTVETELVSQRLRDFRLGGVALPPAEKERFRSLKQRLAALEAEFEQNLMDASDAFEHHETRLAALAGLPSVVLDRAREAAAAQNRDGWLLKLDMPTYTAVMGQAESAELRELYYRAWATRASDQGRLAGRWDNGPLIEEILALRHEAARLLGFRNFAELSLETKMAESPDEVLRFLRGLAARSRPVAARELEAVAAHAGRPIAAPDVPFYSERLRRERLDLDEERLRAYFPLPKVLTGLFGLVETLFGLRIEREAPRNAWHPTVEYYEMRDRAGRRVGGLFTDLYARPRKRGGAWMDVCLNRARLPGRREDPVAHLVCNFNPPAGGMPSLLTHAEVVTLFHELGHSLHHLLTTVDYPSLAGVNGVAWDAVELPSQFLENYAWLPEVLRRVSGHYETGAALPEDKIETLNRSRTFLAGLAMARQLEFALFDFRLHSEPEPASIERVYEILAEVRAEVAVVETPAYNRFPHTFAHVFGGSYAAGYYSYKWAEVLAADAFAAFKERGALDAGTAARFREEILGVGGSRPALDAFVAFRGRRPELGPLLEQSGISAVS
ncbi:MAG TPA: M3 family metallopeptidase [Gammaproteobacteria bacterium]|nr:M3 family metallopeptidase [Gammaproteobacteria bacterium]